MSMMCQMQGCGERPGMCQHEKMIVVVVVLLIVGAGAYFLLA